VGARDVGIEKPCAGLRPRPAFCAPTTHAVADAAPDSRRPRVFAGLAVVVVPARAIRAGARAEIRAVRRWGPRALGIEAPRAIAPGSPVGRARAAPSSIARRTATRGSQRCLSARGFTGLDAGVAPTRAIRACRRWGRVGAQVTFRSRARTCRSNQLLPGAGRDAEIRLVDYMPGRERVAEAASVADCHSVTRSEAPRPDEPSFSRPQLMMTPDVLVASCSTSLGRHWSLP
jgi:hypothetical protein